MLHINEIKAYWWKPKNENVINFGDELTPYIIEYVSKRKTKWSPPKDADMFGIGSILHSADRKKSIFRKSPLHTWGTGAIQPINLSNQDLILHCLRGPLTKSQFDINENIPLGDPGLLTNLLWSKRNTSVKWGLIIHHSQKNKKWVKRLLECTLNCIIIDLEDKNIQETAKKISSCEFICSSSLHGLIIADSYDIPNFWLWDGDLHKGGMWKFWDYFCSIGRENFQHINPNDIQSLNDVNIENYCFNYQKYLDVLKKSIYNSFPFR